jgi:hypothetical protein
MVLNKIFKSKQHFCFCNRVIEHLLPVERVQMPKNERQKSQSVDFFCFKEVTSTGKFEYY